MNAADFPSLIDQYSQLELGYDPELRMLTCWMRPEPRPCFNPVLLDEIRRCDQAIERTGGFVRLRADAGPVDYAVYGSATPGVFNLGGDLDMFVQAILRKDREALAFYANLCVDNQLRRHRSLGGRVTTIALVQGKALGGGFECALACNLIVAERSATFALPETLFNLFPGMGALSFLARKVGLRKAEEMITSGATYTAKELHELGVVDELAEDGLGVATVRALVARRQKRANTFRALTAARVHYQPVTDDEMRGVVAEWVEGALRLESRDLRMMMRLVRAQDRLTGARSGEPDADVLVEAAERVLNAA